jgi:hypothetical protein
MCRWGSGPGCSVTCIRDELLAKAMHGQCNFIHCHRFQVASRDNHKENKPARNKPRDQMVKWAKFEMGLSLS